MPMSRRIEKGMQRFTAWLLILALTAPLLSGFPVQAEQTSYEEKVLYDLEETKAAFLQDNDTGTPTITFPCNAIVAPVGSEVIYHLFRQGNTEQEQTVTLMTTDITAGYQEDYEIVVDGKVIEGEAKPMLDGSDTIYEVFIGEDVLGDSEETSEEDSSGTAEEGAEDTSEVSKEDLTTQMREQASSTFDVTFAAGENVKEIRIRLYMPEEALGNREMQLGILECPEGMETGENTLTAVTLEDSREAEPSEVAIVEDSVEQVDGYVTVLVERTGNTEGYTSYELESEDGTAVNGEDYILDKTQLIFTPGVAVQKIYIPLVAGDAGEKKEFTLKADTSEEKIEYQATTKGATFKTSRDLVDISMSEFSIGEYSRSGDTPAGEVDFYKDDDEDRYIFSFDTGVGDGSNRSASIRTDTTVDFTGIDKIRLSASYRVGTVSGDYLDVYASNTDFCTNKTALASLATNHYGGRIGILPLTGQHVNEVYVDRPGQYYLYITAEQHAGPGYIGYNLYDQEFDGDDEGHVALVKHKYSLELVNPTQLNSSGTSKSPVTEQKLTLSSDTNTYGTKLDTVYRDDTFVYSYELNIPEAKLVGYDIVDKDGNKLYGFGTTSTTVTINTNILNYVESQGEDVIRIRPKFQLPTSEVKVKQQNFKDLGVDGLTATLDEANSTLYYYDNGVRIATFIWSSANYNKGDSLTFKVEENAAYDGDFEFDSYEIRSGSSSDLTNVNPVYYKEKQWTVTLNDDYYEITPILSNSKAPLYLEVKNATHGSFGGKPENLKEDNYTVKDYDGKYETSDIAGFEARPDKGYRAKWSCYDIVSNTTKTYYGDMFYYEVQAAIRSTDNIVTLEFEPCQTRNTYTMGATVYMQGGTVLHQPDADDISYAPLEGASVSVEGKSTLITDENGVTTTTTSVTGAAGEIHTALIMANNRKYIHEYTIPELDTANGTNTFNETIKLSYYYDGPRVTSIRYYDNSYQVQNGDTIYLEDEADICELAATVESNNKKVNRVEYSIISPKGELRMEAQEAEMKGTEYTWTVPLGMYAREGDQIWIELLYQYVDKDGKLHRESYGKVNTGYTIIIADFETVSYIPDTGGVPSNLTIWGNVTFNFSVKGWKPIFTTSRSGNYFYITLGASFGFMPLPKGGDENTEGKKLKIPGWSDFMKQVDAFDQVRSKNEASVKEGLQTLKKNVISFGVPISFQLAFFLGLDSDNLQGKMYFLGAFFGIGFNASYTYSIPFVVEGIPLFATVVVTGSIADTIQIYAVSNTGLVELDVIKDPSKSSYKPNNDFKASFDLTGTVGVGVNGLVGVSGGIKTGMTFDWIDFQYGKGIASIAGIIRLDLFFAGRTFKIAESNIEMFNTSPYVQSEAKDCVGPEFGISDAMQESLENWQLKPLNQYSQSISAAGNALVSDAYEFTRPVLYPMGDGKYLIVCTVDSKYVNGCTEEGKAVLSYVVYDSNEGYLDPGTGDYIKDISGNKIFTGLEPLTQIGDSLNFNPKVVKAGNRGYMVTWNSVLYGRKTDEDLNLSNISTVIKSVIIEDPEQFSGSSMNYKSLVTTNDNDKLNLNMVVGMEYDRANDEVLLLYRTCDLSEISAKSTLEEYLNCDTALCVTSMNIGDALSDPNTTWQESLVLASGGAGNVLKSADMKMMKNKEGNEIPVLTWHQASGEGGELFSESGEETNNCMQLASLTYSGGAYSLNKPVTVPSEKSYQASPALAVGAEHNILMWKEEGRMAVADPIAILDGFWDADARALSGEEMAEDREANADALDGLANITSVGAGNNDDFRLIKGDDGKLYCMWTENNSKGDGHTVKMACLEEVSVTDTVDGKTFTQKTAVWGEGSTVLETEDNNYITYMNATVDKNGKLQMIYRQMDLEKDYCEICVKSKDLSGKPVVSDISVDKNGVKAGETILVTATIENKGVRALTGENLRLNANGASGQETKPIPTLASGETATVQFRYTVPESINRRDISLTADISGNTRSQRSNEAPVTASLYATADLKFNVIKFIPLNVTNTDEPDQYKVFLQITNEGDADSAETEAVASYLEYEDDDNGNPIVKDNVLGHVTIPEIAAGDSANATFNIEVPQKYYVNPECKFAEVDFALYENYETDNQAMVALTYDGVKALSQERLEEIKAEIEKHIGVGQTSILSVHCEPATTQIYTKLTYQSSDPSVASVDENGYIAGHKAGTCTVTATAENGLSTTTKVYVTKDVPKDESENGINENGSTTVDTTDSTTIDSGTDGSSTTGNGTSDNNKNTGAKKTGTKKTGDTNPVVMWIVLLIIAVSILCSGPKIKNLYTKKHLKKDSEAQR